MTAPLFSMHLAEDQQDLQDQLNDACSGEHQARRIKQAAKPPSELPLHTLHSLLSQLSL